VGIRRGGRGGLRSSSIGAVRRCGIDDGVVGVSMSAAGGSGGTEWASAAPSGVETLGAWRAE